MTCHEVEDNLAAYVDGLAPRAAQIDAHLATCADCRASAHAQRVARTLLRERAGALATLAPPGLHTRLRALADDERASARQAAVAAASPMGWTGRLSAFAAAAMVVLTLGAIVLPVATVRSTALLAAQLALDHLKCFTIDGDADGRPIEKAAAEATLQNDFGLSVTVPPSLPAERIELLAVRRCLYGDGRAAHLMYRVGGEPVSLFVLPGLTRPAQELSLFGHDELVWTEGERTYMLVARAGLGGELGRVASYLRTEAK
jgi:anti-sigma factor RsiW